jgi:rhodanese-related sulfurtransferase
MQDGALLIDIHADTDRERDGIVPGSLHIPRTVLEWRMKPTSGFRNPHAGGLDQQIVLICDHGCSSLLAAAILVDLGFSRVGDVYLQSLCGGYFVARALRVLAGSSRWEARPFARLGGSA